MGERMGSVVWRDRVSLMVAVEGRGGREKGVLVFIVLVETKERRFLDGCILWTNKINWGDSLKFSRLLGMVDR